MTTLEMQEVLENYLQQIKEEFQFRTLALFLLLALIIVAFLVFMIVIEVREKK